MHNWSNPEQLCKFALLSNDVEELPQVLTDLKRPPVQRNRLAWTWWTPGIRNCTAIRIAAQSGRFNGTGYRRIWLRGKYPYESNLVMFEGSILVRHVPEGEKFMNKRL